MHGRRFCSHVNSIALLSILCIVCEMSGCGEGARRPETRATAGSSGPPPVPTTDDTTNNLSPIEKIFTRMDKASFAFNAPSEMMLGESATIHLVLDKGGSIEEARKLVEGQGKIESGAVRVTDQVEATLKGGAGFEIESLTPQVQAIVAGEPTEWKWAIRATQDGRRELHLVLNAIAEAERQSLFRTIRVFDKTIEVKVTFGHRMAEFAANNWQWIWMTFLVPGLTWWVGRKSAVSESRTSRKPD